MSILLLDVRLDMSTQTHTRMHVYVNVPDIGIYELDDDKFHEQLQMEHEHCGLENILWLFQQ